MRIVIKVGTSTLAHTGGRLNIRRVELLCKIMSDLKNAGHELLLVTSGAIAVGTAKLGLPERPKVLRMKQAAAAVGQCRMMHIYDKLFSEYNCSVAQILLTGDDVEEEDRAEHLQSTFSALLETGIIPIVNENDTVSTNEIEIGDNDTLAAIVSVCVQADLLVLLTDIDGLYTADPHRDPEAKLIPVVEKLTPEIIALGGGAGSSLGTGGMATKLHAAQIVTEQGIDMQITNGSRPSDLYDIVEGRTIGTLFRGN